MSHNIHIGLSEFRAQRRLIEYAPDDRLRHMYMIGKTGVGKSTIFQNMCLQDIKNGKGVSFIDPHGESIDWLLANIPANRSADSRFFCVSSICAWCAALCKRYVYSYSIFFLSVSWNTVLISPRSDRSIALRLAKSASTSAFVSPASGLCIAFLSWSSGFIGVRHLHRGVIAWVSTLFLIGFYNLHEKGQQGTDWEAAAIRKDEKSTGPVLFGIALVGGLGLMVYGISTD